MMTEELKPCPFCGYRARVEATRDAVGDYQGYVECMDCGATVYGPGDMKDDESAMHEARKEWNKRAERTCRMGAPIDGEYLCSECGHLNRETYRGDKGWFPPRYCAHCGAKVVEGL